MGGMKARWNPWFILIQIAYSILSDLSNDYGINGWFYFFFFTDDKKEHFFSRDQWLVKDSWFLSWWRIFTLFGLLRLYRSGNCVCDWDSLTMVIVRVEVFQKKQLLGWRWSGYIPFCSAPISTFICWFSYFQLNLRAHSYTS